MKAISPMRAVGLILLGFFCITSAARATAVLTCTVYDPAGLSANGACSDFGGAITYTGFSMLHANYRGQLVGFRELW